MINFWKSAAKGKSRFPVRPPELEKEQNVRNEKPVLLSTILENECEDLDIFEKKSRLSPTLQEVLSDVHTTKHFIHFMHSVGRLLVIKCWLELENFRKFILNNKNNKTPDSNAILCRSKSYNLDSSSLDSPNIPETREPCASSALDKNEVMKSSSNLCHNIEEDDLLLEFTSRCNLTNITEEAINIFKKYIALEAPNKLELSEETRKLVISNICQPQGVCEDCFKPVQDILFQQMEGTYYEQFQRSPFYAKIQLDVITGGTLNLTDVLHDETLLFYFTEYLEQESSSVLLECLMAMMHFRENLLQNVSSNDQAQQDAIVIYEKYLSLQATNPIGFPTDVRLKVESEICRDGGPLYSCFDIPYLIIFKTLNNNLKTFLESDIYFKYLSEMMNSVNQMVSHHGSQSDCSSEYSISTQNTLLAMGDPVFTKTKHNNTVPDMTIDSYQLYNADSLWQRKKQDGLNLGRVNSLGRFESKFEPDPDKREKSVLKKMVSRFLSNSASQVEEEMAWQIAHMIVKDVTDLTMAPPESERNCPSN